MPRIDVQVPTRDGVSMGTLHVPEGEGPWPGVLVFTDIFGPRDAFLPMGDRLASLGYVALIPDVYYREGDYAPFDLRPRSPMRRSGTGSSASCSRSLTSGSSPTRATTRTSCSRGPRCAGPRSAPTGTAWAGG